MLRLSPSPQPRRPAGFVRTPPLSSSAGMDGASSSPRRALAYGYDSPPRQHPVPPPRPVARTPATPPAPDTLTPLPVLPPTPPQPAPPPPALPPPPPPVRATGPPPPPPCGGGGGQWGAAWVLRVGCDVARRGAAAKGNVEIAFSRGPPESMPALVTALASSLVWDWDGAGFPQPIDVSHCLHWDEAGGAWQYLCDPCMLRDGDQIYVFRKYQQGYAQGRLPEPRHRVWAGERANFRESGRLRVGGELSSLKVNYEVVYDDALPATLGALRADCERLLTAEGLRLRQGDAPPPDVAVSHFVRWDEGAGRWAAVEHARDLHDGAQLYAQQSGGADSEAPLPAPRVAIPGGDLLTAQWELYRRIDPAGTARVEAAQLADAFASCGVHFPEQQQDELFAQLDCDEDGTLSFGEFAQLGLLYPSIVNYLHFMSTEYQLYWKRRAGLVRRERANAEQLRSLREHEHALRGEQLRLAQERSRSAAGHS